MLRHRVLTNFRAESEGITSDSIIDELLTAVPVPKSGNVDDDRLQSTQRSQRRIGFSAVSASASAVYVDRSERPHAISTAIPGARFVDPKVLARVGNLELLARHVVEGFINGLHRAPFFGASIDFAEHRGYVAGDDIRRVDWRLFARTDRYYVKQYEADTNTNLSVLLDISRSMKFFSRGIAKLDYGCFVGACLAYLAQRQRDRVGLITFDNDIVVARAAVGEALQRRAAARWIAPRRSGRATWRSRCTRWPSTSGAAASSC